MSQRKRRFGQALLLRACRSSQSLDSFGNASASDSQQSQARECSSWSTDSPNHLDFNGGSLSDSWSVISVALEAVAPHLSLNGQGVAIFPRSCLQDLKRKLDDQLGLQITLSPGSIDVARRQSLEWGDDSYKIDMIKIL
eukprot:12418599-Karenia_brevis.AAC.1